MQADLFTAHDVAALLAIRKSFDEGRLFGDALRAAFAAAGLMLEQDETGSLRMRAPVDGPTDEPPTHRA